MSTMTEIFSRNNEIIKNAAALKNADARRESGRFLLEGARLCEDAVRSGVVIREMFVTKTALQKYAAVCASVGAVSAAKYLISDACADRLADTKNPQGIFCVCKTLDKSDNIDKIDYNGIYVLTDALQNPDNVGALARTAEALGANGLILCGGADRYNPKALRSSMGSLLRLPVYSAEDAPLTVRTLRDRGMRIFVSVVDSDAVPLTRIEKGTGRVLVIGNEGNGVSPEVRNEGDCLITIPMAGRAESLNASAAAAILLWEFIK